MMRRGFGVEGGGGESEDSRKRGEEVVSEMVPYLVH